jgi:lauroyl/myristoyl acyltransferase
MSKLRSGSWHKTLTETDFKQNRSWRWRLQGPDYAWLLPLLARLPLSVGAKLSRLRGSLNARLARDWAELSLGFPYIGERTAKAGKTLWPDSDPEWLVRERYRNVAREEWHAALIQQGRLGALTLELDALRELLARRDPNRGLVVLTAHFDSFIVGMLGLGLRGVPTSVTTSNVYEDVRVHPAVRQFFDQKYRSAEQYLQGGRFLHVEHSMRALMRALSRHEAVIVVADAPATDPARGLWLPWLGECRALQEGAIRMARDTGSQLCAMVCLAQSDTRLRWLCSDLFDPQQDPECAARAFGFLDSAILAHPGRWWASHLLGDYPRKEVCND